MLRVFVITSPITAWLAAVLAFVASGYAFTGNVSNGHDLVALSFWAAIGVLIMLPLFYWPMFLLMEKLLGRREPIFAFPLIGTALSLVPAWLLTRPSGGAASDAVPSSFVIFFSTCAAVGIVAGFAFAMVRRPR